MTQMTSIETWATPTQESVHSTMGSKVRPIQDIRTCLPSITTLHSPSSHTQNSSPSTLPDSLTQSIPSQHTKPLTDINNIQVPLHNLLTPVQDNTPFGEILTTNKQPNTIRFFFKNVNGILKAGSWHELTNLSKQLDEFDIDIFGAAETNLFWTNLKTHQAKNILHKYSRLTSLQTSSNSEGCMSSYQPGGTMTVVRNKTASRISEPITDHTKLGRWSGFRLHTNDEVRRNIHNVPTASTLLSYERNNLARSQENTIDRSRQNDYRL
jgi:hypothetical protein